MVARDENLSDSVEKGIKSLTQPKISLIENKVSKIHMFSFNKLTQNDVLKEIKFFNNKRNYYFQQNTTKSFKRFIDSSGDFLKLLTIKCLSTGNLLSNLTFVDIISEHLFYLIYHLADGKNKVLWQFHFLSWALTGCPSRFCFNPIQGKGV